VSSLAGRELEKVLAVRATQKADCKFYDTADDWLPLADSSAAIRTTDLWKTHFAAWRPKARKQALAAADLGFAPAAKQFIADRKLALEREIASQREWLSKRVEEITGTSAASASTQRSLFESAESSPTATVATWQTIANPEERLAAFHSDREQPVAKRAEAEGVIRIYEQRLGHLKRLLDLREPEIVPLGVLMLIPEANHGA
jgi:hypothetical protein